mgnify:CR=1 FL=1
MLFALLLGMSLNFLNEQTRCCAGINFTASTVLRIGVALLGLRITIEQVLSVGMINLAAVSAAIAFTMLAGVFIALRLNRSKEFGILSAGSVSICGASAAMAIATVLPNHPDREKQLVFTILCVTTLSTLAMVLYPVIAVRLGLSDIAIGYFLGGSIHDVAQVVGAGYSVSAEAGDFATITKLYRVLMLIPVFLVLGLLYGRGRNPAERSRLPLPWFIVGFVGLLLVASSGWMPASTTQMGIDLSKFCLVTAIAALGMKTSLKILMRGSGPAIAMLVLETVILALIVLGWVLFSGQF